MTRPRLYALTLFALCFAGATANDAFAYRQRIPIQYDRYIQLVSVKPGRNQHVRPPNRVVVTFSRPIKAEDASIVVTDDFGAQLTRGPAHVKGKSMMIGLPSPLRPGRYLVKWRAKCNCEDVNELSDDYSFIIK